jgi:hypothetical protein
MFNENSPLGGNFVFSDELKERMLNRPRMNIYAEQDDIVYFDGEGGYNDEKAYARMFGLVVGQAYTVEKVHIGDCTSRVKLLEYPGRGWNTCLFYQLSEPDDTI